MFLSSVPKRRVLPSCSSRAIAFQRPSFKHPCLSALQLGLSVQFGAMASLGAGQSELERLMNFERGGVLTFIASHNEPDAPKWTKEDHWGNCGQSCGCCRAQNPEDWGSGCQACVELWTLTTVSTWMKQAVQQFDGVSGVSAGA